MKTVALIVAAGRGSRATRSNRQPKQYIEIGGTPVLAYALMAFPPFVDAI